MLKCRTSVAQTPCLACLLYTSSWLTKLTLPLSHVAQEEASSPFHRGGPEGIACPGPLADSCQPWSGRLAFEPVAVTSAISGSLAMSTSQYRSTSGKNFPGGFLHIVRQALFPDQLATPVRPHSTMLLCKPLRAPDAAGGTANGTSLRTSLDCKMRDQMGNYSEPAWKGQDHTVLPVLLAPLPSPCLACRGERAISGLRAGVGDSPIHLGQARDLPAATQTLTSGQKLHVWAIWQGPSGSN